MPPLSSLEPYLRPLNGLRSNPYTTRAGREGMITAYGDPDTGRLAASNTMIVNNDEGEAQRLGDTGPAAQLDRMYAAESAAKRSADLNNWLNEQAAQRVPAMLERDDPEAAARIRAGQLATLRPETPATPNLDALNALLQFESPLAGQARSRAMQEKIQGQVQQDTAGREAEANFALSPLAARQRETLARERRTQTRQQRDDELSALLDPRALAAQATETAGRLSVAQAQNPPDYRTLAFQNRAGGQPGASTTTQPTAGGVALTPMRRVRYQDGTIGVQWSNGAVYEEGLDPNTLPPEEQ